MSKSNPFSVLINIENHDITGMLDIDKNEDMSGACITSGLANEMALRVGANTKISSGLFIDNEKEGCVATVLIEEVVKTDGNFSAVEQMRQKHTSIGVRECN